MTTFISVTKLFEIMRKMHGKQKDEEIKRKKKKNPKWTKKITNLSTINNSTIFTLCIC